jgi:hypothetical protein
LPDPNLPSTGPGRSEHGNFVLSEIELFAAPRDQPDDLRSVEIAKASADFWQDNFQARKTIDAKPTPVGPSKAPGLARSTHLTLTLREPIGFLGGTRFTDQAQSATWLTSYPRPIPTQPRP